MRELFTEVTAWQRAALPDATARGAAIHLEREARELLDAIDTTGQTSTELADCVILCFGVADRLGMSAEDLVLAVRMKLAINRRRKWKAPDANGTCEHVREP